MEEAEQVSQVVKDLVNHTKKWKPRKELLDLNDLIERTLEGKALKLSCKRIRLVEELAPSLPLIHADPKQIRHVFLLFSIMQKRPSLNFMDLVKSE